MGSIPGSGRPLGGMATHAGVLAWEIPRAEEPGALPSTGSRASDTGVRAQRCRCEGLRPPSHTVANAKAERCKGMCGFCPGFFFFNVDHFLNLGWIRYDLTCALCLGVLDTRHVWSQPPNQGPTPCPPRWKVKAEMLGHQRSPSFPAFLPLLAF